MRCRAQGAELTVQGVCRVQGAGCWEQGAGCRAPGSRGSAGRCGTLGSVWGQPARSERAPQLRRGWGTGCPRGAHAAGLQAEGCLGHPGAGQGPRAGVTLLGVGSRGTTRLSPTPPHTGGSSEGHPGWHRGRVPLAAQPWGALEPTRAGAGAGTGAGSGDGNGDGVGAGAGTGAGTGAGAAPSRRSRMAELWAGAGSSVPANQRGSAGRLSAKSLCA